MKENEPTPPLTAFGRNPVSGGEVIGHIMADGTIYSTNGEELELEFDLDGEIVSTNEWQQLKQLRAKKEKLQAVRQEMEDMQASMNTSVGEGFINSFSEINLGEHGQLNGVRT